MAAASAGPGSAEHPERAALHRLEGAVDDLLERLAKLRRRLEECTSARAEAEELVRRFTGDEEEAARLLSRIRTLHEENAELRHRLGQGRATVERLLARLRFLEDQR